MLLDEQLSSRIARRMRDLGHDVVAVTERSDLRGLADDRLLAAATAEHRVLVTINVRDYPGIAAGWTAIGRSHAGLVVLSPAAFATTREGVAAVCRALDLLAGGDDGQAMSDRVAWLAGPTEGVD
jgi:hypothetical protein